MAKHNPALSAKWEKAQPHRVFFDSEVRTGSDGIKRSHVPGSTESRSSIKRLRLRCQ